MTQKAKQIVSSFPQLSLAELWVIIEAAQAQIRKQTVHPEGMGEEELLKTLDRRYEDILKGKVKLVPGHVFDAELEKTDG